MKSLPHDYYLKFIDAKVFGDIQEFHAKTNFVMHASVEDLAYLHNIPQNILSDLTGNELEFYPDMSLITEGEQLQNLHDDDGLSRNSSCDFFEENILDFLSLSNAISPLLCRKGTTRRGYPSGGALYPVEVFICNLSTKTKNWPCRENVLHLLPYTKTFEIMQNQITQDSLMNAILPGAQEMGHPNLAIIYAAYIPKTIFKYRYRGYRLAHLEAGSMYMLVDLMSKRLKLPSRLWSGYCDNMVCKQLKLNPTLLYPLCIQLMGGEQ